ncbi:MAG: hypothetical protein AAFS12_15440, partial [Cyanobacteria bacterium J06632_19]
VVKPRTIFLFVGSGYVAKQQRQKFMALKHRFHKITLLQFCFLLFFSMQDANNLLNQVKKQFPKADIQVVDVDGILNTLQEKNDPWLDKVVFFPNPEARQYIQKLPRQNSPSSAPAKKR